MRSTDWAHADFESARSLIDKALGMTMTRPMPLNTKECTVLLARRFDRRQQNARNQQSQRGKAPPRSAPTKQRAAAARASAW